MKVSEINLLYIKEYLSVDGNDDDRRLQSHLDAAKNFTMQANGYTTLAELDANEYLSDVVMVYVQQLYDTGTIFTNKSFMGMLTMDRRY